MGFCLLIQCFLMVVIIDPNYVYLPPRRRCKWPLNVLLEFCRILGLLLCVEAQERGLFLLSVMSISLLKRTVVASVISSVVELVSRILS